MRGRKVPCLMEGSIWPRMEICGSSGLPIPIVPRLHQSNDHVKRKLRAWRVQKCITLVGAYSVLTSRGRKVPRFMWGRIGPKIKICGTLGLPILIVQRLHQSNGNIKRKIRAWRVQKCIALLGADTLLTSLGPQSTQFYAG